MAAATALPIALNPALPASFHAPVLPATLHAPLTFHAGFTTVQLATLAFAAASAALGLFIAVQAFRGLVRHDSRQMLYLGGGMVLLFGVAYGISIVGGLLVQLRILELPRQDAIRLLVRVVQFAGLACIAYSLRLGAGPGR